MYNRKYKSGTIWCFWRWTQTDSEYIRRLHILKTPWFAICLHWILKPDPEPFLHDHPVTFLSIILRGGYGEKRWSPERGYHTTVHRWFNWIRASVLDRHTINYVKPHTVTLCFMGPKIREWGFSIPDPIEEEHETGIYDQFGAEHPSGWAMWKDYYTRQRAQKEQNAKWIAEADRNGGVLVRYPASISYRDNI